MNVKQIVETYLKANGFDGLYSGGEYDAGDCGCDLSDLMPCGGRIDDCVAAYKIHDACAGHYYRGARMSPKKEEP